MRRLRADLCDESVLPERVLTRTNLITSRETDQEVISYASERGIGTYSAMNELLKLGLGYYRLFGRGEKEHVHVWDRFVKGVGRACVCGTVLNHTDEGT